MKPIQQLMMEQPQWFLSEIFTLSLTALFKNMKVV